MKTNIEKLAQLKRQLEAVYSKMPQTQAQIRNRDRAAFLISQEIEALENPASYAQNKGHWEGHQIRF